MKHTWLASAALMSLLQCANAQTNAPDIPAFPGGNGPGPAQSDTEGGYSLNTPIEKLAADPAAAAVVDKTIPGLLEDDNYPMFKGLTLNLVASLSSGQITDDMLAQTAEGLKAVPAKTQPEAK